MNHIFLGVFSSIVQTFRRPACDKKAARLIIQEELTTELLSGLLKDMTRNECLKMSKAALENKATKPEEVIYQACEHLIKK